MIASAEGQLTSGTVESGQSDLVSVIVPSYCHASYLPRCLDSIFNQTYRNIEIIAIDDGSTDDSLSVLRQLQARSPFPMSILAQNNKGAGFTINRGIHLSRGKYVNIINTDDEFGTDRIAVLLKAMHGRGSEFAFAKVRFVDDDNQDVTMLDDYAKDIYYKQSEIPSFVTVGFSLMTSNVAVSTGNFLFSRSLFDRVGDFNPDYRYCHDWDFILRSIDVTEPVYVDEPLYLYRLHVGNSFRGLADAAAWECPRLIRNFFRLMAERPGNPSAPCPAYWGEYFWKFIGSHEILWHLINTPHAEQRI